MLARSEARELPQRLADLGADSWLDLRLAVCAPAYDGFGMFGSGMYIINPPWVMPDLLESVMPWLVSVLGEDEAAGFDLEHKIA
jgi:23S rRNA (adenine2030-N6)-methyltransferase